MCLHFLLNLLAFPPPGTELLAASSAKQRLFSREAWPRQLPGLGTLTKWRASLERVHTARDQLDQWGPFWEAKLLKN